MLIFQSDVSRFSEYAGIFLSVINTVYKCWSETGDVGDQTQTVCCLIPSLWLLPGGDIESLKYTPVATPRG